MNTITGKDYIDSRDIDSRIDELESLRDDFQSEFDLPDYKGWEEYENFSDEEGEKWCEWEYSEDGEEWHTLTSLRDEVNSGEWRSGIQFIRESFFVDYAQELAEECGEIDPDARWPMNCIDWDKAAEELKCDYSSVDIDGVTYYYRD